MTNVTARALSAGRTAGLAAPGDPAASVGYDLKASVGYDLKASVGYDLKAGQGGIGRIGDPAAVGRHLAQRS